MKNSIFTPVLATSCLSISCLFFGTVSAQTIVSYTSPVADYQPFVDEKITSWKNANDKVGQIGGWRAYAKEAQQPDNTPISPTGTSPNVQPNSVIPQQPDDGGGAMKTDPHSGHKK